MVWKWFYKATEMRFTLLPVPRCSHVKWVLARPRLIACNELSFWLPNLGLQQLPCRNDP
jgi:hypothetical protein